MTELFVFLLFVCGGGSIGAFCGLQYFGTPGLILGTLIGPFIAVYFLMFFLYLWMFVEAVITGMFPHFPPCGNGKCKSGFIDGFGDYEFVEYSMENGPRFRCKCGKLYQLQLKERRVLEVLDDGTIKPYMIARPFHGWCPEGQK